MCHSLIRAHCTIKGGDVGKVELVFRYKLGAKLKCVAAFMALHINKGASAYVEVSS